MNKNTYQPWNIEMAIQAAKGFERAGDLIVGSVKPLTFDACITGGVNYGIAIELYIKIIYFLDKGYLTDLTKLHKLGLIYDELSPSVKSEMLLDFLELAKRIDRETLENINQEQDILRGYLIYSEKICVKWRYYGLDSKKPPVSGIALINGFLNILKSQIKRLKQPQ